MPRKTLKLADLVEKANQFLRESPEAERAGRIMLKTFVEGFMHDADNYNGFRYLGPDEVVGAPGIIFDESPARAHVYPDDSRVSYNIRRR